MYPKILRIAFIVSALMPLPLFAQDQTQLTTEARQGLEQSEKQMAKVLADLRAKISAEAKPKLQQAQRTWLRFRDEECTFETEATEQGSAHSMLLYACKGRLTDQRIKQLDSQLNCEDGNLSCVH